MIKINKNIQSEILMTTMEEIVPEDSLFRKIDKYIDFTFIYEEVKDLYCDNNGRPSVDPVVLFKIVFIQAIDGLKSMRQTCKKLKVDAEYRWFLGIPFGIDTPHFSTFSKNYERRFKDSDVFENIFINIVNQAVKYNLVDGTTFYTAYLKLDTAGAFGLSGLYVGDSASYSIILGQKSSDGKSFSVVNSSQSSSFTMSTPSIHYGSNLLLRAWR